MNQPEIVTLEETPAVLVRDVVPMASLSEFFGPAFEAAAKAAGMQGVPLVGPPVAVYFGPPTDTVDVGAGFATARPIDPQDDVTAATMPGGRAAQLLHVGSYDSLPSAWGELMAWLDAEGLTPGEVTREVYLNDPDRDAPENNQTLIVCPLEGDDS